MTIVAPKWAQQAGNDGIKKAIQGTGAYRLVEWSGSGSDLVLEANDKYWGTPANVKRVRVKLIPEQSTRAAALRSKDIHVTHALWPEDEGPINNSGSHVTKKVASNRIPFYFIEVRKPPFDKKEVRQAINYAANIDGIIKTVLQGNGTRTAAVTAPWHIGNSKQLKPYPYDPNKAKELLKQAGFADGIEGNMWFIQGRYMKDKEVAEAISQELGKVGIKLKPNLNDASKQTQMDLAKQLDGLIFASWGNWMFDVDNIYFPLFHSSARDTINQSKGQSSRPYGDPAFDKMLEDARVELDDEKRQSLYDRAEAYFYDQAPVLFMYQLTDIYGVDKRVNWEPRSDEMIWYREMNWA
jgi:peptide/nickel transport system substrate-binding protein